MLKIKCAQALIRGMEAHRATQLNERTIIKMVGYKAHGLCKGNRLGLLDLALRISNICTGAHHSGFFMR